jgi:hypothetical protein
MNYYNFFTEIEEHFVMRRGKHLLISPMDWNLIAAWRDAGVPLHVALRGIDIAMDGFLSRKSGSASKVNSLCYCHDAVMEAFASHVEAHVGESADDAAGPESANDGPEAEEIILFITGRINEIAAMCAKQYQGSVSEGIGRVTTRLQEIIRDIERSGRVDTEALERDLALTEELLITELRTHVPDEEVFEWENEAKKELKVYKKRLPKETFQKIHANFLRDKVRRRFRIGELSLFNL